MSYYIGCNFWEINEHLKIRDWRAGTRTWLRESTNSNKWENNFHSPSVDPCWALIVRIRYVKGELESITPICIYMFRNFIFYSTVYYPRFEKSNTNFTHRDLVLNDHHFDRFLIRCDISRHGFQSATHFACEHDLIEYEPFQSVTF